MKKILLLLITFLIIFILHSCNDDNYIINNNQQEIIDSSMLIIDLKGAIRLPNVYTVKEGTILYELINLAGGFDINADTSSVNLALVLKENQMIQIPYKKLDNEMSSSSLININTATKEELCTLPGIGSAKATNIINYRTNNGYFITIEDLKKVSGIGEELFNKVKEYICD